MASAGDVNGDGYGDVVVGAYAYDNGSTDEGRAYVYLGSSSGLATSEAWTAESDQSGAYFGRSATSAGDVNGDGYGDVVVGAYLYDNGSTDEGRAYVYLGSSSGLATSAAWTGSTSSTGYCDPPGTGFATVSTDCDDALAAISPAATEVCDTADTEEDCDGLADDADSGADGKSTFYVDADADGYGSATTGLYCDLPSGYVADTTDCDDAATTIHPAAAELPGDAVDRDCDGTESCYVDGDDDGARTAFVVASPDAACTAHGEALAAADLDCDDSDATAYPAATEITGSGTDEACDSAELCYADADDDGYRPDGTSTVASSDGDCDDDGEALSSALTGDCDDTSTAYNPAAAETDCSDASDYNCDGSTLYADADGDGWAACEECDDLDASVSPVAAEVTGDGIDSDCDGGDTCYVDADGDGYRPDATSVISGSVACDGAGEASDLDPTGDCDDTDSSVNPAAVDGRRARSATMPTGQSTRTRRRWRAIRSTRTVTAPRAAMSTPTMTATAPMPQASFRAPTWRVTARVRRWQPIPRQTAMTRMPR
ncbi:MAG: MopE-related protein [Pseudomonadota bacterium]|nr:MopE-related protein [Pseudomonadota bacterium]